MLLHGLASNARIWDLTAPHLIDRFRVMALDQRGHGLSDKPDRYAFDDVSGDVAALIDRLELDRPLVVGHSWGGNVAVQLAADYPGHARGIILVDGGFLEISSFDGMTWERAEQMMAPPPLDGLKLDAFLKAARSWPGLGEFWDEAIQEIVLANLEITQDQSIRPRLSRANHMKILRAMWEQRPSALWDRLACPVLMVPAARDDTDPRNDVWMKGKMSAIELARQKLSRSEVVWMTDTIHDVPLQRPKELAAVITEFAAGLP